MHDYQQCERVRHCWWRWIAFSGKLQAASSWSSSCGCSANIGAGYFWYDEKCCRHHERQRMLLFNVVSFSFIFLYLDGSVIFEWLVFNMVHKQGTPPTKLYPSLNFHRVTSNTSASSAQFEDHDILFLSFHRPLHFVVLVYLLLQERWALVHLVMCVWLMVCLVLVRYPLELWAFRHGRCCK